MMSELFIYRWNGQEELEAHMVQFAGMLTCEVGPHNELRIKLNNQLHEVVAPGHWSRVTRTPFESLTKDVK